MKRKRIFTILVLVLLTCALSTTAFAIDESEVESAIAASSQEEVAGQHFHLVSVRHWLSQGESED